MTGFVNLPFGLEPYPAANLAAGLALGLVVGFLLGVLHFRTLRLVSVRLLRGDFSAIALQVVRFAVLAATLFALAKLGAAPLLSAMVGVLVARGRVVDGGRVRP